MRNKVARSIRNTHKKHGRKETLKQQRKPLVHRKRNGKKQKEKTQKTGGQMKTCDVKNRIFSRRRVPFMRLCTYGDKNRCFVEIKIKVLVCCSTFSAKQITCNISLSKATSESFVGDQYKRNRTSKNPKIEALVCSSSFSAKRKACRKETSKQQRKRPRTHQNRSFSVCVHLLCQTKNIGSEMAKNKNKKRRRRVGK